jgi:hypothetical protein
LTLFSDKKNGRFKQYFSLGFKQYYSNIPVVLSNN